MKKKIRIIRPSSQEVVDLLPERILQLEDRGFEVFYQSIPLQESWTYTAGGIMERSFALDQALNSNDCETIWCARGGYGASDLLENLNWETIISASPKKLIGFSDISALHSALYTKCNWKGIHAPMLATTLWNKNGDEDIELAFQLLENNTGTYSLPIENPFDLKPVEGVMFGGCFSVLTNLIGTPYFPKSLKDHILFFEDVGEHPARLMRYLNQWIQSGALKGVKGILLGNFSTMGENIPDTADFFVREFYKRVKLPIWTTNKFGHLSPNFPLIIGSSALLENNTLFVNYSF